jgi:hypothetical protein
MIDIDGSAGSTHIAGIRCGSPNTNGNVESYLTVFDRDTGNMY